MQGGQRALVTGVHGLEHVERLRPPDLADDDAVGPHPQGVAEEVPDLDLAGPLGVGGPGFERHDVRLVEPELGGILDGDDPVVERDESGDHVEDRGLAGAGPPGDEDVQLGPHAGLEEHCGVDGE